MIQTTLNFDDVEILGESASVKVMELQGSGMDTFGIRYLKAWRNRNELYASYSKCENVVYRVNEGEGKHLVLLEMLNGAGAGVGGCLL